jgi:hypothetical protein
MPISIEFKPSSDLLVNAHAKVEVLDDDDDDKLDMSGDIHGKVEATQELQLCYIAPNGTVTPIRLDSPDYKRLMEVYEGLKGNAENCDINFSDAIVKRDGDEQVYASPDFAVQQEVIRSILSKIGHRFPVRFYASSTERSPEHAPPSLIREDCRLAELTFDHKKIEMSLGINDENPIKKMGEKLNKLKRDQVAKRLLQIAEEQLKEMGKRQNVPADRAIPEQGRQQAAAAVLEVITGVDRFAIQFGAIHAGVPLEKKEKQALELIQSQSPPKKYVFFSKDVKPDAEREYAKDLARIGIERRGDYLRSSQGTVPKATQAEDFFVALTQRIAKGEEVDSLLTGSLFEKAFGKLDVADQSTMRQQLLAECAKLSKAYQADTLNVADGAEAPTVLASGRPWTDLFKEKTNRGQVLQDAVEAEMKRLLNPIAP